MSRVLHIRMAKEFMDIIEKAKNDKTLSLVVTSLFVALTFVATWLINIRLPLVGSGGLIHLGNVPLFIAGMLFGRKCGAVAGGIGMALFDLMSGWSAWAPFTLVIVGLMGYLVGVISEKQPLKSYFANNLLAVIVALIVKVAGYYFAEVILFGNWVAPFGSIPGNIIQVAVSGVIVLACMPVLRKAIR